MRISDLRSDVCSSDLRMSGPREGEDCWRIARALKASVIVDADAYFRHARAAMMKAKRRIMLIGWDFDAAITLIREDEASDGGPTEIGRASCRERVCQYV